MTENERVERRRFSWRGGASPAFVLALLGAVGAGGYESHRSDAMTNEQARALGEARTRYEQLQQHCQERESDRMRDDMQWLREHMQGNRP